MYETFYNSNNNISQHTRETFQAFVDALIPTTPGLAEEYGQVQYYGASELDTYEYIIMILNYYDIPLAKPTAEMLDIAADQLIFQQGNEEQLNYLLYPGGGTFAALAPNDRFRALTLLDQLNVNLSYLPMPFTDDPGLVLSTISTLNQIALMGYYSEWNGYGTTRLESPNLRVLEFYPLSWNQVGYPGPSLAYRALTE